MRVPAAFFIATELLKVCDDLISCEMCFVLVPGKTYERAKCCTTYVARERSSCRVHVHVNFQHIFLWEWFFTEGALERALSRVHQLMPLKNIIGWEALAAVNALEWPNTCVSPLVIHHDTLFKGLKGAQMANVESWTFLTVEVLSMVNELLCRNASLPFRKELWHFQEIWPISSTILCPLSSYSWCVRNLQTNILAGVQVIRKKAALVNMPPTLFLLEKEPFGNSELMEDDN